MSKDKQVQQDNQSKTRVNKPVQEEMRGMETAVINPIPSLQRAYTNPRTLSPTDAQVLQRTIGNQALGRLIIQRKMTVGPVGDKYEQEADAVAKQVVGNLNNSQSEVTQRQEEVQMQPLPSISTLQRQEEEEDLQMNTAPGGAGGGALSSNLEQEIQSARGGGQSLADPVRGSMEQAFGSDFGGVRVHTGRQSDTLNRSIQARAFTTGQDIFFRNGEYNPGNTAGQELLAHELTHVVQQSSHSIQKKEYSTSPNVTVKNKTNGTGVHLQRKSNGVNNVGPFNDLDGNGIYGANVPVNATQVSALIRAIQQKSYDDGTTLNIKVLTGTHGSPGGHLIGEANFYQEDLNEEGNLANTGWINVNNVITVNDKDRVTSWMEHGNRAVILAWCYSAVSYANWDSRHCWKTEADAQDPDAWNKNIW